MPTYGRAISVDLGSGTTVGTAATIGPINGGYPNWQQRSGSPGFVATNLQDDTGAATTCDLEGTGSSGNTNTINTATTNEGNMFERALRVHAVQTLTTQLILSQIPYALYDIVVCVEECGPGGVWLRATDGNVTYQLIGDNVPQWSGSWQRVTSTDPLAPDTVGNYFQFEALTAADITINVTSASAVEWGICGMQIIERFDDPPPASFSASYLKHSGQLIGGGLL